MTKPVAVLGATGTVGQKMIAMLEGHPLFHVEEVAASDRSLGKNYGELVNWKESNSLSARVARLKLKSLDEVKSPLVISALPADTAKEIEPLLASRGQHVFSNASAWRMEKNVPLLIPEVNASHLELLSAQKTSGKIVTNPNCSTVFAVMGLAPLLELAPIEHVSIVTLQAISGAGYPGIASLDILGNVVPHIGGEEDKIQQETKKILGTANEKASFNVTVHVHRVPVQHGHTVALHVFFKKNVNANEVIELFRKKAKEFPEAYKLHEDPTHPQPLYDLTPYDQRAHIGRIKQGDAPHVVGLISLGHNLVRGAAGAALLNMEKTLNFLEKNS